MQTTFIRQLTIEVHNTTSCATLMEFQGTEFVNFTVQGFQTIINQTISNISEITKVIMTIIATLSGFAFLYDQAQK